MKTKHMWTILGGLMLIAGFAGCGESRALRTNDAAAGSSNATLTIANTQEYGPYLADQAGRALYLLEDEPKGQSTCYGQCAEEWPPLLASNGSAEAGNPAVREDLIGTIQRRDGSTQVTYNGHPLYYYVRDRGPGQTTGQDFTDQWGEWYLVTAEGRPLEEHHDGAS